MITVEVSPSYYRARYYDPNAGRFLSEDPVEGTTGELDFYSYVDNHPTGLIDPSGLNPAAPTIPWPRVLPYPIRVPFPWIKVGGGIIGILLNDALIPQPTSSTDTLGKDDPLPNCKRKRECADQYARDLLWCEFMFSNNLPLLMRCYEIADLNLESCLDGKPPVEPDPEKNPGPKGPPPGGPKPPIPFPGKGKSR
jgi:hypothetical protein